MICIAELRNKASMMLLPLPLREEDQILTLRFHE